MELSLLSSGGMNCVGQRLQLTFFVICAFFSFYEAEAQELECVPRMSQNKEAKRKSQARTTKYLSESLQCLVGMDDIESGTEDLRYLTSKRVQFPCIR